MLFGLSFLDAITLVGVRLILAIGYIPFGLLGLWLVVLTREAGMRWGLAVANALIAAFGLLLLYTQFVDAGTFGGVVVIVAASAIAIAAVLAVVALLRARAAGRAPSTT